MVKIGILGGGSAGNSMVISTRNCTFAIDAGFSGRELRKRMAAVGIAPDELEAVLLTHEHTDHSKGCRVFCNSFALPLYASSGTATYLRNHDNLPERVVVFERDNTFELNELMIHPFAVRHDAVDPVGFSILTPDGVKIGVATDLGILDGNVERSVYDSDVLVLECNYCPEKLRNSNRPELTKRRIAGRNGHLENADAVNALEKLVTPRTKLVLFGHVSRECNDYDFVRSIGREKLDMMGRQDVVFDVILQDTPLGRFELAGESCTFCGADI
ncbi:MAG: MBL fold metallo-hydrolase [Lentisphaeria bacterium]|nr:MBL fold metallo-hydrolase [Lentisphaeria bacterium]MBR7120358.1 MBL fold metallo-hydrolase [Lentisphaeria bacterium]